MVPWRLLFLTMNEERCNKKILILKIMPKFNFPRTFLSNFHRFRSVDLLHADLYTLFIFHILCPVSSCTLKLLLMHMNFTIYLELPPDTGLSIKLTLIFSASFAKI